MTNFSAKSIEELNNIYGINLQRLSNNPIKLKISDLKFILKNKIS